MKKFFALVLTLMLLCSSCALAETELTVSGSGTVYATADLATIAFNVTHKNQDARASLSAVNAALLEIRAALEESGVAKSEISSDNINIYDSWEYDANGDQVIYYCASTTLVICTKNLEDVGKYIDAAVGAGATSLYGVSFGLTDSSGQQEEALRMALANARKQAEIIAEASGLSITGIEKITEESVYSSASDGLYANKMSAAAEEAYTETVVEPAKIAVKASVSVVYEAK